MEHHESRSGRRSDRRRSSRTSRSSGNDYKLSVLAEYDRCTEPGEKGALLRREGLYSSIITDWRRQHREGHPGGDRGPRFRRRSWCADRRTRSPGSARENERLKVKLAKAEAIIEVQGKVQALLEAALQERGHRRLVDTIIDTAVDELVAADRPQYGHARRSAGPGRPTTGGTAPRRCTGHRHHDRRSHRALTEDQVDEIVDVLNSERFCDQAPAQVWATLLDEGRYLASVSTMYRILRDRHQVRERRRQARHPAHLKPELVADRPEPGVVVGHHQTRRPPQMDLVPPLRHLRRLVPLRRRLARRPTRIRPPRPRTHRRLRHRRTHRTRPADPARRPRQLDDLENRRPAPRRPRRHPLPLAGRTSPTTTRTAKPSSRP